MSITAALAVVAAVAHPGLRPGSAAETFTAVPFTQVHLRDPFWAPRLETNRAVTLQHVLDECAATGRIANFEVAAGLKPGGMTGYFFNDSDLYKAIEGVAYILMTHPDDEVEARCDEIIETIAAAQEPDGYLYTPRTIMDPDNMPPGGAERWSDIGMGHELYCSGHLYEAAVAYFEATGKRRLLDVARHNAELVLATFGPGRNEHPPGHPEIEIGLGRLFELTRDQRYLDLMEFLVHARGRAGGGRGLYGEYAQDEVPALDREHAAGHAVRLAYLYAGVTDLGRLTGDARCLEASIRVWNDIARSKLYVTGGVGSQGNNEGFGAPYDLPNSSAYNETCSSIAMVLWSHRLNLATGDARYADLLERTLYNGLLAGWALSGDRFFYPNPLASDSGAERQPWFGCACCPPNVLRFFASLPRLQYATSGDAVLVNLYASSDADVEVAGTRVAIAQETSYPWAGHVTFEVRPERPRKFALRLRVPGWARGEVAPGGIYAFADHADEQPTLRLNGQPVPLELDSGYAVLDRLWAPGDRVELDLPMPVRRVVADERVAADRDRAALGRGPLVYCFEAADNPDATVQSFVLEHDAAWRTTEASIGQAGARKGALPIVRLAGSAEVVERDGAGGTRVAGRVPAIAIPYFAWANRTRGAMCVWAATDPGAARPAPYPTLAHRARASSSFGGNLASIADQLEPSSSGDHDNPFLHWWPRKGTEEWVQYDFPEPGRVTGVEVYWFDDTGRGECRLPKSWRLLALVEGQWKPVERPDAYGVEGDRYNRCRFDPVVAEGLRVEVRSRDGWAGGIHEWRVLTDEPGTEVPAPADSGAEGGAIDSGAANNSPTNREAADSGAEHSGSINALPNPSFEMVDADAPRGWTRSVWGGSPSRMVVSDDGRDGRGVLIASERGADAAFSCTVPVELNSRYRLSGWIETRGVEPIGSAHGALLNIHGLQEAHTSAVTGTQGWTFVSVDFDTGLDDSVTVNCLFGGWGLATGTALFDDIALELLERGAVEAPRVTVDAATTGEPISAYIYGQFIEHLGRCIYGGIWAEMLEDRKFFHAAGAAESPWRGVGTHATAVTMDEAEPFVGAHSPRFRVAEGTGLVQDGLALEAGRAYVGHAWLAADGTVDAVDIALRWGTDADSRAVTTATRLAPGFVRTDFRFVAGADTGDGSLAITARGPGGAGSLRVGTVSLMPADNVQGFRRDTLTLLRRLDAPVYRWPGGNFVSGYDWRDGIGDRDRRPPRKNPAWTGVEHNDVGIHEFLALCDLLETEPYVAINTGLGSVESAVDQLAYLNAPADTPMGRMRADHGRTEPWGVRFVGIGNEMYGGWQLGNVPLTEYTKRHNAFVDALRAVDPGIVPIAVGAVGAWSRTMLRDCAAHMDYMSEHVYWQERPGLLSHVMQAPASLRATAEAHRRYRRELESLRDRDIRICEDEWNYWYGPHVFGELGTRYFMKDALGCAAALHEFGRNSDIYFMANYAQTVNVIGAIKTSPTHAAMETTGLVLELYRKHLGTIPCATEGSTTIDALAAWTEDRSRLTIGIVNASREEAAVALEITGAELAGTGTRWTIASDDPEAYNDPDGGSPIETRRAPVAGLGDSVRVPACSVTLLALDVR